MITFYLFDSHLRDMRGLSIAGGTSVLLKFASLLEVESYNQLEYLEYRDIQRSYFQVQFLNIVIDRSSCWSILSHYQRFRRRLNYQHRSEIISEIRRSKLEEAQISKNCEIF